MHEVRMHRDVAKECCGLCEFVATTSVVAIHRKREHVTGAEKVGKEFVCQTCGYKGAPGRLK